jgi:hypothetical protein
MPGETFKFSAGRATPANRRKRWKSGGNMADRVRRPSFQFYPADWRKDPELQSCSLAARGLWVEMLCIMHEAEPYGHLVVNGKSMNEKQLSRAAGGSLKQIRVLLSELESTGVFSRSDDGVIYSRRMVKDQHIRTVRAHAGAKGAAATNAARLPEGLPQQKSGKHPPPSSSSSSSKDKDAKASSSSSDKPNVDRPKTVGEAVRVVFDHWRQVSGKERTTLTADRKTRIKARLKKFTIEELKAAIDGAHQNPFYLGDNPQQQYYGDITTIFKSDSAVEKHRDYTGPNGGSPNGNALEGFDPSFYR